MDIDLTKLLETILLVIVTPFVPILATRIKLWLDASASREQQATIVELGRLAVLATEQAGLSGAEAKDYALAMAQTMLDAQNIKIDVGHLSSIIEAMVMEEFNKWTSALGDRAI